MTKYQIPAYSPGIDGLRALAVLAVIVFHLDGTFLPGGFVGVDIFFVISGYVVSKSLSERVHNGLISYLLGFYERRLLRIIPALLVMLVVVCLLTTMFIPVSWLSSTTSVTAIYAFFGISNIALVLFSDGYFSPVAEFNPFVHTWSLGVEEQFYLIFPLVILVWINWRGSSGFRRAIATWILPVLSAASLLTAYWMNANEPVWGYYLLPSRFWELAAGVMLYQQHSEGKCFPPSDKWVMAVGWTGVTLVSLGLWYSDQKHFPFPWALLSVFGTLLIITAVVKPSGLPGSICAIFSHRVVVYLGKMSYSLYLWHWPVFALMRWTVGLESLAQQALALSITFCVSFLSYRYIEQKFQRYGKEVHLRQGFKVSIGVAVIVLGYFTAASLFDHRESLSLSKTRDKYVWYPYEHPVEDIGQDTNLFHDRKLFVFGDSHANSYMTLTNEIRVRLGVKLKTRSVGQCTLGAIVKPATETPTCKRMQSSLVSILESESKPGDIVFLASLRTYRLASQWALYDAEERLTYSKSERARQQIEQSVAETSEFIELAQRMGLYVLIDAPKPVLSAPPVRCSDWFNASNPICSRGMAVDRDYLLELRGPVMGALRTLKDRHANVIIWDPFPILCPGAQCQAFDVQGLPLFWDGDHLSGHGNRVLYADFYRVLKSVWAIREG